MRVALMLSANPRSFKRCYDSFDKNILQSLQPDAIFLQTWRLYGNDRPEVETDGSCEEYVDLYKPTSFEIENLWYNYQGLSTMAPHLAARYKCFQLLKKYEEENNTKFDVVICHRPDVRLLNPFKREYADMVEENDIWIHHFKQGLPADYHFYGSRKWMEESINTYFDQHHLGIYKPGLERLWWFHMQKAGYRRGWFKFFGNSIHDQEAREKSYKLFDIECVR